jgi:hydrogenase expression/formation protein HypE
MRDLTRGGLSSALNEIAQAARLEIALEESNIVISPQVRGVCELLGLDPLYVANEGRFIAFVPAAQVEKSLSIMKSFADLGEHASCIGFVNLSRDALVTIKNSFSQVRILSLLSGQQLPRIC